MVQLMQLSPDMYASVARHLLQIKDLISFARLCNKALRVQLAAEFDPVIDKARALYMQRALRAAMPFTTILTSTRNFSNGSRRKLSQA